jgi:hypothetical protein
VAKRTPGDDGHEEAAASRVGTETAACVGFGNTDQGSGRQAAVDEEDDNWSPVPVARGTMTCGSRSMKVAMPLRRGCSDIRLVA